MQICTCCNCLFILTSRYSKIHPFMSTFKTWEICWILTLARIVCRVVWLDAMSLAFKRENSVEAHAFCDVGECFLLHYVIEALLRPLWNNPHVPQCYKQLFFPELCGLCLSNEYCQHHTGYVLVAQNKNYHLHFYMWLGLDFFQICISLEEIVKFV